MPLNSLIVHPIPRGQKFVALSGDGAKARVMLIDEKGEIYDAEYGLAGVYDASFLLARGYTYWMELPGDFRLWFEK